jgi:hypothetical protein
VGKEPPLEVIQKVLFISYQTCFLFILSFLDTLIYTYTHKFTYIVTSRDGLSNFDTATISVVAPESNVLTANVKAVDKIIYNLKRGS